MGGLCEKITVFLMIFKCFLFIETQAYYPKLMLGGNPPHRVIHGQRIPVEEMSLEALEKKYFDEIKSVIKKPVTIVNHFKNESAHKNDDKLLVSKLAEKVRVLCWVMTCPENHWTKAIHVKKTWGRRCNKLLFMSTEEDPVIPTVKLPVSEGKEFLWAKTKAAFRYIYTHHRDDADWFLKAEDDTFVIVENLRFLLLQFKTNYPIYIGPQWLNFPESGAGYVLSREALRRLANSMQQPACSKVNGDSQDVNLHKCLHDLGIRSEKSQDLSGRERFFAGKPQDQLFPYQSQWWKSPGKMYNPHEWNMRIPLPEEFDGIYGRCSPTAISFHYIEPKAMYVMEYMLYHLRAYGTKYDYYKKSVYPNKQKRFADGFRAKPTIIQSVTI